MVHQVAGKQHSGICFPRRTENLSNMSDSMQAAGSVLNGSGHVVWVDCAFPVPISRIISLSDQQEALSTRFHHFQTPGLPQVLALFHRQKAGFPPEKTSLLIIDNVSSVFPLPGARQPGATPSNSTRSPSTIFRSTFLASLTRIASSHNIAIVLTSDATTRFRYESKAMLVGSMGGKEWEEPLSSRIALFREFPPQSLPHENILEQHNDMLLDRLRYAGVMKANGIITVENDAFRDVVPFTISNSGTILPVAFPTPSSAPVVISPPAAVLKRRIGEVPDSEEEDWDAEVESLDGQDFEDPEDEIQILQAELPVTAELEDRSKRSKPSDGND